MVLPAGLSLHDAIVGEVVERGRNASVRLVHRRSRDRFPATGRRLEALDHIAGQVRARRKLGGERDGSREAVEARRRDAQLDAGRHRAGGAHRDASAGTRTVKRPLLTNPPTVPRTVFVTLRSVETTPPRSCASTGAGERTRPAAKRTIPKASVIPARTPVFLRLQLMVSLRACRPAGKSGQAAESLSKCRAKPSRGAEAPANPEEVGSRRQKRVRRQRARCVGSCIRHCN